MRGLILVACASLSIARAGLATPIVADFVEVRYSGTITVSHHNTAPTPGDSLSRYPVGDSISGTLRIDLRNAPADLYPDEPNFGAYRLDTFSGPSFVTGFGPTRQRSSDGVQVQDHFSGQGDLFSIGDAEQDIVRNRDGGWTEISQSIGLTTYSFLNHVPDFITGEGLVQRFALHGDNLGTGDIQIARQRYDREGHPVGRFFGGVAQFVITRMSVRPGMCAAP